MGKTMYYLLIKKKGDKKWTRAIKQVKSGTKKDVRNARERIRRHERKFNVKIQTRIVTIKQAQKYLKNKKRVRRKDFGKKARVYKISY